MTIRLCARLHYTALPVLYLVGIVYMMSCWIIMEAYAYEYVHELPDKAFGVHSGVLRPRASASG